ncbi:TonB-dependent receptor [Sphingomonas sp.]|uniref:TonB-dependent receptor n=1 Tax=Sphingomonas sp. TaxID=28214 RepID=UPI002ED85D89
MRNLSKALVALVLTANAAPAFAQEVIVTTSRRAPGNFGTYAVDLAVIPTQRSVISLKRSADYVVQTVWLAGDTREAAKRTEELEATLRNAIDGAGKAGVEIALGDYVVQPLTLTNYKSLSYIGDGRPDTSRATFLVKVRLTPGMSLAAAKAQIAKFVESVAKTGRTTLAVSGEPTLSVVNPDQYRGAIVDLIAADATVQAAKFGATYGVDVSGLDRPVEWARAGATEVFLFLPATYVVRRN